MIHELKNVFQIFQKDLSLRNTKFFNDIEIKIVDFNSHS